MVDDGVVTAMERRIETRDLRKGRLARQKSPDRCKVVRLVKRRQRHVALEVCEHLGRNAEWPFKIRPSMRNPVPDGSQMEIFAFTQPCAGFYDRRRDIRNLSGEIGFVDDA